MDLLTSPVLLAGIGRRQPGAMIDRGAHCSVCPHSYVDSAPVIPGGSVDLASVTGEPLQIAGMRLVECSATRVDGDVESSVVRYVVADVKKPIRAVAEMIDGGWEVHFGTQSWMRRAEACSRRGVAHGHTYASESSRSGIL